MTIAVRPPEYFPRLEYAALLLEVDRFVVADTFPYSRQSAQNRCRIRTARPGERAAMWLTVPVVGGAPGRPITDVEIAPDDRWRATHRKTLLHHYGSAPFFDHYWPEIEELTDHRGASLSELTVRTVHWAARALHAPTTVETASSIESAAASVGEVVRLEAGSTLVTLPESAEADERAVASFGASTRVMRFTERPRRQNFPGFVPGCSVLDLILNHGPESADYLARCVIRDS